MARLLSSILGRRSLLRPDRQVGLEIDEGDRKAVFSATIQEVSPDTFTLSAPLRDGGSVAVRPGARARVYYTDKERVYAFESQVSDFLPKPVPSLVLIRPDLDAELTRAIRNERGRFVRYLRVEYRIVPRLARYLALTREISEESTVLSTNRPLEVNTIVDMNISLPDELGPVWTMGTVNESHVAEYDRWRRTQRYGVVVSYLPGKLSADDRRRIAALAQAP